MIAGYSEGGGPQCCNIDGLRCAGLVAGIQVYLLEVVDIKQRKLDIVYLGIKCQDDLAVPDELYIGINLRCCWCYTGFGIAIRTGFT